MLPWRPASELFGPASGGSGLRRSLEDGFRLLCEERIIVERRWERWKEMGLYCRVRSGHLPPPRRSAAPFLPQHPLHQPTTPPFLPPTNLSPFQLLTAAPGQSQPAQAQRFRQSMRVLAAPSGGCSGAAVSGCMHAPCKPCTAGILYCRPHGAQHSWLLPATVLGECNRPVRGGVLAAALLLLSLPVG